MKKLYIAAFLVLAVVLGLYIGRLLGYREGYREGYAAQPVRMICDHMPEINSDHICWYSVESLVAWLQATNRPTNQVSRKSLNWREDSNEGRK